MATANTPEVATDLTIFPAREVATPAEAVKFLSHSIAYLNLNCRRCSSAEQWRPLREAAEILECLQMLVLYTMTSVRGE